NELIIIAQAASVQYMIAADYDDVVERPAATEAGCPQTVDFVKKAKRAGLAKLRFERRRIEHHTTVLLANQRVGEADLEAHRKAVIGQQRSRCTILDYAHRFEHFYRAPRCVLLDEPGTLDQEEEGRRTGIPDWYFRPG